MRWQKKERWKKGDIAVNANVKKTQQQHTKKIPMNAASTRRNANISNDRILYILKRASSECGRKYEQNPYTNVENNLFSQFNKMFKRMNAIAFAAHLISLAFLVCHAKERKDSRTIFA